MLYIEKISGATLPIVAEPSGETLRIYVGISPHTEALGLETDELKYGAYRMASGPDWLALLGPDKEFEPVEPYPEIWWGRSRAEFERVHKIWDEITGDTFWNPMPVGGGGEWYDDRGTLNAVHAFLHDLGVRWYMPGDIGEVVPRRADIALPSLNRVVRPDFPVRNTYWFQGGAKPTSEEDQAWQMRLGLNLGHDIVGLTQLVHGMKFVLWRDEMKEAHPELYAVRGDRRTGYPCLSSEALFEKHVAYLRAVFNHYDEPMISIDPADGFGGGACECPDCTEQLTPERGMWTGRMSDYVWGYLNRVAWALHESHPDRLVSGLTYGSYRLPPERIEQMAPNFVLFIFPPRMEFHDADARADFDGFLAAWREKLSPGRLYVFGNVLFNWETNPWWGLPVYFPRRLTEHLRSLKGVSGGDILECYEHRQDLDFDWNAQAVAHLTLYTYSRAWWDADLDIDAMLDEYYTLFYGPAREEMKAFIEHSEENWPRMRSDAEPVARAIELLAAAQSAVDPDSVYGRRIALIADYTRPMHPLRDRLSRPRDDVPRTRLSPARPAIARKQLDGRLDDEHYWGPGFQHVPFSTGESVPRDLHTAAGWGWVDNAVYFKIRCAEPDMAGLRDRIAAADGALREGDFVEVRLETLTHAYYRITISPSGAILDADMSEGGVGEAWVSNAEAGVHLGEDFWSVELRIPLAGEGARLMDPRAGVDGRMPTRTYTWHFNVGRQRVRDGQVQRWAWPPTSSDELEVPERFAEMWGGGNLR